MPEALTLDLDALDVGDLEDFEEQTGKPLDEVLSKKGADGSLVLSGKELKAFVWVVKRKTNPDFTLDDARKVKLSELNIKVEDGASPKANRAARRGTAK